MRASEVLEALRKKRAHYARLLALARPFADPRAAVQPNLVTKDGLLSAELERTRVLAVRLAVEVQEAARGSANGRASASRRA